MARPRLSVVLAVFREQAYLRDCVSSLLGQSFRDVEVIAVDNASPDHEAEILADLAQADDRLAVTRLEAPVSLGEARNRGLEAATGDYVWFVAPTTLFAAGALAAVAERLDETAPDVLVVDHRRAAVVGGPRPGPHRELLAAAAARGSFTLDEEPAAAALGYDVRDTIFRRAFLEANGLRFAPGGHGHVPLTYPALVAAERISVLPRACSTRVDPPRAPTRREPDGEPFDVFDGYEAVYSFAGARGGSAAERRALLPEPMLRHYLAILAGLPPRRRKAFFAGMSESYRRHAGTALPADPELRRSARLVARGRYRSFRALRRAAAWRRSLRRRLGAARRLAAKLAGAARRRALRLYYRLQLRAPLDPDLAVFAAYWYAAYSCNPRAVYEKLAELAPHVRGVWVVDRTHAGEIPPGVEHVVAGTRAYYRLIARATVFVNNVNFPNDFVKRQGTVHVQTHHGTPLKTMGLDLRGAFTASRRMDFDLLLRRSARWDYSISSNAFSTLVWERAYPTEYESLEVGYPRNDVLANATDADVAAIRERLGIPPGARAVLFAPTHREYLREYVPTADVARLADELGPEYVIMLRVHYFYDDLELELPSRAGRILDVTGHPSIEELCLAADVLVTDYSSIMFDYAVLDRPIVVHAPDWDVYRTLRGTYFDLLAEPPGVVTATDDELVAAFRSGAVWSEHAARLRAAFRARFASLDDGRAAERVVRRIWLGEPEEAARPSAAPARARTKIEA